MKKFKMLNIICASCELSSKEKLVAQYFIYKSNKVGECYPAVYTIARACGVSERTIQRATKKLQEKGFISIVNRYVEGKQTSNQYCLNILLIEEIEREKEIVREKEVFVKVENNLDFQEIEYEELPEFEGGIDEKYLNDREILMTTNVIEKNIAYIDNDTEFNIDDEVVDYDLLDNNLTVVIHYKNGCNEENTDYRLESIDNQDINKDTVKYRSSMDYSAFMEWRKIYIFENFIVEYSSKIDREGVACKRGVVKKQKTRLDKIFMKYKHNKREPVKYIRLN